MNWREPFDQLAEFTAEPEDENGRKLASPAERLEWLPLLDRVRTWIVAPSLAVRQQFETMDAMKRLVPDLGMSLAHGDGWRQGTKP